MLGGTGSDVAVPLIDSGDDRALLTYLDDATGERVDLTAADLGGWAARTAALLREGCLLERPDRAAVLLPPHWQTAAVLLGAWSIGMTVAFRPWATAGLQPVEPGTDEPYEAVFVSRARLTSWLERVPDATHRFVLRLGDDGEVPEGYRDYAAEVARYPDVAPAYRAIRADDPATPDGTSYGNWADLAREIADRWGLRPGDRVLLDAAAHEQPVQWLLAPLLSGASIVLCANLDASRLDAHKRAEAVTRVL